MRQLYAFVVNESTHNKNHIINAIFVYWLFHYYFPVSFFVPTCTWLFIINKLSARYFQETTVLIFTILSKVSVRNKYWIGSL